MSWTKHQLVSQALEEIGYAGYIYDIDSNILTSIMSRLDAMLGMWNTLGIVTGYPLISGRSTGSLEDDTCLEDGAIAAVYLNLAIAIAPMFGKTIQPETKQAAKVAYTALTSKLAMPNEMNKTDGLPKGAGNKQYSRFNFYQPDQQKVSTGTGTTIELS